jgi:hypothetical protein
MSTYTEDHLVEQPAIQLMQHELGWEVVNCYGEPSSSRSAELRRSGWNGGLSNQGRDANLEVLEKNDFLISLKATFSPSAETGFLGEIKSNFHEKRIFTSS